MADMIDAATCTKEQAQEQIGKLEAAGEWVSARAFKQRLIELARPQRANADPKPAEQLAEQIAECREAIAAAEDRGAWATAAREKSRLLALVKKAGK